MQLVSKPEEFFVAMDAEEDRVDTVLVREKYSLSPLFQYNNPNIHNGTFCP